LLTTSRPRSHRVYDALKDQIRSGVLQPGTRLPGQLHLADEFGVALMTVRQGLAQLAAEGMISIEHGRGMFVRAPEVPAVLIVEDEVLARTLLSEVVQESGFRPIPAASPQAAITALESNPAIGLVLTDIRMKTIQDGIEFVRTVRRRWPTLPLAAVTAFPQDLASLHGQPECPVLIINKPFHISQIDEALRLAMGPRVLGRAAGRWANA
jgi:DNA-binding transcriptional regulator YhcF (GntR family)